MTDDGKKPFRKASEAIDLNLNGLLGKLGEVLSEAVNRLDQAQTGDAAQNFETPKGPARASASLRVRVGGLDQVRANVAPKPVNPSRKSAAEVRPKDLTYDLFEDADVWILTAELPGVDMADLSLVQDNGVLILRTTGARAYQARIPMPCTTDQITPNLHNGILTLHFPKGAPE